MNPIRVLQVIDTLGMGGAETWLMEVLRFWSRSGDVCSDFLLTSGNRGLFDDEAHCLGARLFYLPFARRTLPRFIWEFRRILREGEYAAVHDHQDYASGWHFGLGGRWLPQLRVTHVHNPSYQITHNYGISLARRLTARVGKRLVQRNATHIAGTSRQILTEYGFFEPAFQRIPKGALYCGFDPSRFNCPRDASATELRKEFGWPRDSRIVLFAGRIDQSPDRNHARNHKNSAFAVDVGIAVARRDSKVYMILAGRCSAATPVLEARIADAGMAGRIRFLGIRGDIGRLMRGSDVLLFPSRAEGLGMVAVEAQAAGLPVLMSTTVPEESIVVCELVRRLDLCEGEGLWATNLLDLLKGTLVPMGEANRRVRESMFAIENSAKALRQLYENGILPGGLQDGSQTED